ncbi:hypothetical protein [Brevundimonas sp.]|uniref:hypothetical protein n=1 Tax=Brevundimonas sp. TaxID=1871086 RepID=UPI001DF478ED|nr:hypothetical protein [Brevundimonas sp.]MBA3999422.1 hypothetical protein [Brevundimonas sp.]
MLKSMWIACLTLAGALSFTAAGAGGPDTLGAEVRVLLAPRMAADAVAAVDVRVTLVAPGAAEGDVLIEMPLIRAMAPSALQDSSALSAWDDRGPLALTVDEDPVDPTGFRQDRRWRVQRATAGDVVVRYQATPREITPATRPGPLYDMRGEGQGFHGSGAVIIALPPEGWPRPVRIDWDLSDMPEGARGASSHGEGSIQAVVPKQGVASSYFMAGPLHSLPRDGRGAFVGYWITPPAFDLENALRRIEDAYGQFSTFFGDEAAPFRVFMRTTPAFAGGGSGGYNSFMFGNVEGQSREEAEVLGLLVHETLHNWLNGLGEETSQWWSEGTTSYYTEVLSYRAGLTSLDQFQRAMNDLSRSYYTNPRSDLSNDEVTRLFFSDGDAQLVPYQRGPIYFAQVDARIRAASNGAKRVDDLVLALLEARRNGGDYSRAGWVALLRRELGEAGVAEFEAMMAGRPMDLPDNLLGPCFERASTTLRRFEPGFRVEHDGRVTRLLPEGHGALAGVRDGDRLADRDALEALEAAGPGEATLALVRGGRAVSVAFEPWGPARPGYRWLRNDVPEQACGI